MQKYDASVNINSGVVDEVARKMRKIIEYADTRSGKQIKTDNVYNRYPSCSAENTGRKVFFAQEGGEVDDGRWLALPQQNLEDSMRRYVMENSPRLYELSPSEDYSNVKETQRFYDFDFLKDRTFCRPVDFPFVFDEDEKIYQFGRW